MAKAKDQGAELAVSDEERAAAQEAVSNWEFIDRVPTEDEVRGLLAKLPAVFGVLPLEFYDFVQALPSPKKVKVRVPTGSGGTRVEERHFQVFTLYFSVAGRQAMLQRAAEMHGWQVDFIPEPVTPTGIPGFLENGERIVYREYLRIKAPVGPLRLKADDGPHEGPIQVRGWVKIGKKPGQAWVPHSGGTQAKGSNPYEKVETAARGRALAAWGFGVLPGSGVASVEEMMGVPDNRAAVAAEEAASAKSPEDLRSELLEIVETLRELTGRSEVESNGLVADWIAKKFQKNIGVFDGDTKECVSIDLNLLNKGQLVIAVNSYKTALARVRADRVQDGADPA